MAPPSNINPVPRELLVHIGDITVSFALLESVLQSMLSSFEKRRNREIQILATYLSFGDLCAAVLSTYRDRHGEDEDFTTLQSIVVEATKIAEERNRITHSVWGVGGNTGSITRMKTTARLKKGLESISEEYDSARFEAFIQQIHLIVTKLVQFQYDGGRKGKFTPLLGAQEDDV